MTSLYDHSLLGDGHFARLSISGDTLWTDDDDDGQCDRRHVYVNRSVRRYYRKTPFDDSSDGKKIKEGDIVSFKFF